MKTMRNLTSVVMLILALTANAQVNPVEGYIITNQNDTVRGMIDLRTNEINASQCLFKANSASEYVTYKPGEIAAYRFKETGKYYVSKQFNNENCFFAEFLVKGSLNLYRKEIGFRKIYYVENEDGNVETYEEMEEDENYNAREARIRAQGLYRQVAQSSHAVKDIKIGKMSDKQMIKMVRDYHDDVCTSNEDCILFEQNPKSDKVKVSPMIYAGGAYAICTNKTIWEGVKSASGFTLGAGIDVDRARSGKGLVFQLSLQYSRLYPATKPKIVETIDGYTLNGGLMYRFPMSGALKLAPRFGLSVSNYTGNGHYKEKEWEMFNSKSYAPYVGCGIELPVGKHALNFCIDYKCLNWAKVNMFQATLGFRI